MMRISQLAERSGIPATTLRFYDSVGLLPADRTPSGYRMYDEDAVERLSFIATAKRLGLPLEDIAKLLALRDSAACADVKAALRPRLTARIADAGARAVELAGFTATLHRALEHLDALPDRSGPCDPTCDFLDRATPASRPVEVPPLLSPEAAEAGEAERWRCAPVTCSLTATRLSDRTVRWHEAVHGAERAAIPEGLRLTLPASRAGALAELAAAEQQCCPFFDFRLHFDGPVLHLDVRAPQEAAAMMAELLGPSA
ncbi:MerR family transcriptional regulator [Streptomyces sp. NPDC055060]